MTHNTMHLHATAPGRSPSTISFMNAEAMAQHQQQHGNAEHTSTSVELSLSCKDLPDCDIVSKSDPQIFVYLLDLAGKEVLCEIGRTEVIQDDLNPKFVKKILMQYHFEQIQRLRFQVYDIDPVGGNDFLGGVETTLAEIVAARSSTFKQRLQGGPKRKKLSYLIIDVEELVTCKQVATFDLSAHDLSASCCGLFAPSTSVNIYRSNENGTLTIVYRSPLVQRNCNPKFATFTQKLVSICNGDLDRSIRFELIDRRFNMERNLGFFEATINSLKSAGQRAQLFNLMHERQKVMRGETDSDAKVTIDNFKIITQASFLDYIRAGVQIHFVVAIDFTASNGDPSLPDSLHYLDPMGRKLNPYEQALISVGQIIKPYNSIDCLFAGFGFGAKLLGPNNPASHLFPLNGNEQHPYVTSIEDLVAVYRQKMKKVLLSGPTNFSPSIAHCSNIARQFEDGNHYFILLIVTDGIISDMLQTKKAIIEASRSPMSIIICGVGDAEFAAMDELDSDNVVMRVDNKAAERDIVQFVPMNKFMPQTNDHSKRCPETLANTLELQRLLAEEVLHEIPDQLTGYMLQRGFHSELTYTA